MPCSHIFIIGVKVIDRQRTSLLLGVLESFKVFEQWAVLDNSVTTAWCVTHESGVTNHSIYYLPRRKIFIYKLQLFHWSTCYSLYCLKLESQSLSLTIFYNLHGWIFSNWPCLQSNLRWRSSMNRAGPLPPNLSIRRTVQRWIMVSYGAKDKEPARNRHHQENPLFIASGTVAPERIRLGVEMFVGDDGMFEEHNTGETTSSPQWCIYYLQTTSLYSDEPFKLSEDTNAA